MTNSCALQVALRQVSAFLDTFHDSLVKRPKLTNSSALQVALRQVGEISDTFHDSLVKRMF